MWGEFKDFLSDFADILISAVGKLWKIVKWLVRFLATASVWLWGKLVIFYLISLDLAENHLYALLAAALLLLISFSIINKLQKYKGLVYIPWYRNPKIQPFVLIPIIVVLLGLVVGGGPISFSQVRAESFDVYLGAPGYLDIPTTIWAAVITFVLVCGAGVIALRRKKEIPRAIKDDKEEEKEKEVEKVQKVEKVKKHWWDD